MAVALTLILPAGHGRAAGDITVDPGQSVEHGNVVVSCPAGGDACVRNVAADGTASHQKTGDMPMVNSISPGPGLTRSTTAPIFAAGTDDTIAELLPDRTKTFAPLTAALDRSGEGFAPSDDFHIVGIRSDGANGFHITYSADNGELTTVHMEESDYDTPSYRYYYKQGGGERYWFFAHTDAFSRGANSGGSSEFDYFDAYSLNLNPTDRLRPDPNSFFVFGARTASADMPAGSADYQGRMRAYAFDANDPSYDGWQMLSGQIRIAASFDLNALDGRIRNIDARMPNATDSSWAHWPTSSFKITDGRIVNGQFTATLTGMDLDPDAPLDRSVRGYLGAILGEFYGPGAEEVGGVLNAARDAEGEGNDRVLNGFIGGGRVVTNEEALTSSTTAPIFSAGTDDTIAELLPDQTKTFAPVTASMIREFGNRWRGQGVRLSGKSHVSAIRSDGANGFHISFVHGGEEKTVHFSASDYGTPTYSRYYKEDEAGNRYWFYSSTDAFRYGANHAGSTTFNYLDIYHLNVELEDAQDPRFIFVFGARTETANMPAGGATYHGRFRADSFETTSIRNSQRLRGNLRLVANFNLAEVTGRISALRGTSPGGSTYSDWSTSGFEITEGRIVNGQFTATLTGVDTETETSLDQSLRGFVGDILGEFYGPGGAEVGGVLNATRDDRVLQGAIGGKRIGRVTNVTDSEALTANVDRNDETESTSRFAVGMPTVESTVDGIRLTYMVDGELITADFDESDFGKDPGSPVHYFKRKGTTGFYLRSRTGSFEGGGLYEHFDINTWNRLNFDADDPDRRTSRSFGYIVYGTRTAADDMPGTGSASYNGRFRAHAFPTNRSSGTSSRRVNHYRGDFDLTADFGSATVAGSVTSLESRPGNVDDYMDASGGLSFNAMISGNGFSAANLSGSGALGGYRNGSVNGAFYGPGAAEVGGVMEAANNANTRLLVGAFGGKKGDSPQ